MSASLFDQLTRDLRQNSLDAIRRGAVARGTTVTICAWCDRHMSERPAEGEGGLETALCKDCVPVPSEGGNLSEDILRPLDRFVRDELPRKKGYELDQMLAALKAQTLGGGERTNTEERVVLDFEQAILGELRRREDAKRSSV